MRGLFLSTSIVLVWWLVGPGCGDDDNQNNNTGPVCGNGVIEAGEICDGSDLAGESCDSLGWDMGSLLCTDQCEYDVILCVGMGPLCGNWIKEYGEDCDTNDLDGATCVSIGMGAGTLSCKDDCTYDVYQCGRPASCGNFTVEPPEECDGADLNGQTCQSLGYTSGTLICGTNCAFDILSCSDPDCGNGVKEPGEQCDASDFGMDDCVTYGHSGGYLQCTTYCIVDESRCTD